MIEEQGKSKEKYFRSYFSAWGKSDRDFDCVVAVKSREMIHLYLCEFWRQVNRICCQIGCGVWRKEESVMNSKALELRTWTNAAVRTEVERTAGVGQFWGPSGSACGVWDIKEKMLNRQLDISVYSSEERYTYGRYKLASCQSLHDI